MIFEMVAEKKLKVVSYPIFDTTCFMAKKAFETICLESESKNV